MFTKLKYCKWGFMVVTMIAWLIMASLVTLVIASSHNGTRQRVHQGSEQSISNRHATHSTVKYIN